MTTLVAIDHVQLAIPVGAEAAARPFYRDLLGLTEVEKPEPGRSRGGSWYEAGPVKVHLGVETDFRANRKAHPAFVVEDLADLSGRAEAAGYEVKPDGELEGVERAFIFDPFGNRLEFIQAARRSAPLDLATAELRSRAHDYAEQAEALADDPHLREAVVKIAVASFVWALNDAFDDMSREALNQELKIQSAVLDRAISGGRGAEH